MKKCFDAIKFKEKKHHSQTSSEHTDLIKLFDIVLHDCLVDMPVVGEVLYVLTKAGRSNAVKSLGGCTQYSIYFFIFP